MESAHTNRTPWHTSPRMPALAGLRAAGWVSAPHTHAPAEVHLGTSAWAPTSRRAPPSAHTDQLRDSPVRTDAHLHVHAATARTHHAHQTLGLKRQVPVTDTACYKWLWGWGLRGRWPGAGAAGESGMLRCPGVARDRGGGNSFPHPAARIASLGRTPGAPLEEPPPTGHSEKRPPTAGMSPQKPPGESAVSSTLAENPRVAPGRGVGAKRTRPRLSPGGCSH